MPPCVCVCVWLQSFVSDLQRLTRRHTSMQCYGLGLGLDTFRIVSLGENFRRLDPISLMHAYSRWDPLTPSPQSELPSHGIASGQPACTGVAQSRFSQWAACQYWSSPVMI